MSRDQPVIRFFFAKMKAAFLDLPEAEKMEFMRKDRENLDTLGMKAISMVDCRWSNDEWDYIGVEQWPSMDAIREREAYEKEELEIGKYVEAKIYLGTPSHSTTTARRNKKSPILSVWLGVAPGRT